MLEYHINSNIKYFNAIRFDKENLSAQFSENNLFNLNDKIELQNSNISASSNLSYYLGDKNYLDIEISLEKDEVLNISNSKSSFIPEQQTFQNKVNITTKEQPNNSGFYYIQRKKDTLQILAYNTPKEESILNFMDLNSLKEKNRNIHISTSIANVFKDLNEKNEVHWLWKWFLALAIVSLLLEILILKFYKP